MKTYEVICANCGNKFTVGRNSRGKKYCSNECKKEALKKQNKKITNKIVRGTRVKVTCEFCGKVEEVTPSRTSKYHACSIQCASKLSSKRYSKKIDTTCAVCGKPLSLKPYRISRLINPAHITCSKSV